jgi:4-hydroxy-tetrahydrodipicolinate reductase
MGQAVVKAVLDDKDLELVAAVDLKGGMDAGTAAGTAPCGVVVSTELSKAIQETKPEVMVDFTRPDVVFENAMTAIKLGVSPVIGTTGLSEEAKNEIKKLAEEKKVPVFIAPNFAIGAVLMMLMARQAAKYLPDVEILTYRYIQTYKIQSSL